MRFFKAWFDGVVILTIATVIVAVVIVLPVLVAGGLILVLWDIGHTDATSTFWFDIGVGGIGLTIAALGALSLFLVRADEQERERKKQERALEDLTAEVAALEKAARR